MYLPKIMYNNLIIAIMGFNLVLTVIIVLAPSIWMLYYGIEVQWMLLLVMFIIPGSSLVIGLWNYWCSNVLNGLLILSGIVLGFGSVLGFVIFGKLGYFPLSHLVISYMVSSSYYFILLDSFNKVIYVGLLITLKLFDSFYSGLFWMVIWNALVMLSLIQLVLHLKVLLFISSLITYLVVILLLLFNLYLFAINSLLIYIGMIVLGLFVVLSGLNRLSLLPAFRSASQVNPSLYLLLAIFLLSLFSFIPSYNLVIKLFSLFLLIAHSWSFVLFIVVFMIFIYQVYLLRSLCLLL